MPLLFHVTMLDNFRVSGVNLIKVFMNLFCCILNFLQKDVGVTVLYEQGVFLTIPYSQMPTITNRHVWYATSQRISPQWHSLVVCHVC